jgi:putative aldouronate transport system substrate-binding protein
MNAFIYDPQGTSGNNNSTLVLNNGKVDNNANKEGWKQGLAYIKSLYDAGLIDQGAFTQNPDALKKEGDNAETVILGAGAVLHPATFVTLGQADGRDKQYDAVPPLTGPGGIQYAEFQPSSAPGATFVLTNKASKEAQIAAIKMLDLNYTPDGQSRSFYGIEGQDWRKPQAGDVPTEPSAPAVAAQINLKSGEKPHNAGWGAVAQYFMPKSYFDGFISSTDIYSPDGYLRRLNEATKLYAGKEPTNQIFPYWGIWIDPSVATEYATLQTNIENYIQQNTLQFITGSKSLDKDWDSYVKGLDQLGLPRYLELNQQAYDASSYKK